MGDTAQCRALAEQRVPRPVLVPDPQQPGAGWGQQLLAGDTGGTADPPDGREGPELTACLLGCTSAACCCCCQTGGSLSYSWRSTLALTFAYWGFNVILYWGIVHVELGIIVAAVPGGLQAVALFPLWTSEMCWGAASVCPDGTCVLAKVPVSTEKRDFVT